ncbi:MAG: pantoate--beta-alanine ligase [Flavobacteriales bacterium]|nr:pantoate--beta-alanine ligase [Flavobacteriales bacterium]
MLVLRSRIEMMRWSADQRRRGNRIGFVPTMGALHEGHLALLGKARGNSRAVAVSIFVNPLQFNDPRDFERYPVQPKKDRRMLESGGCDVLFMPDRAEVFEGQEDDRFPLGGLDSYWEGPMRPGHFQGVVNVVDRLFGIVRPDAAFFGEKDRQQLTIIQWVASQQRWPVEIIPCPTIREQDGLAMSSRNRLLDPVHRGIAPMLHMALQAVADSAFTRSVPECLNQGMAVLQRDSRIALEYLGIADARTLRPLEDWADEPQVVALIAARLGDIRLIDNLTLERP